MGCFECVVVLRVHVVTPLAVNGLFILSSVDVQYTLERKSTTLKSSPATRSIRCISGLTDLYIGDISDFVGSDWLF